MERLFLECVLQSNETEAGNRLGAVFSLDPKLYEVAADAKLKAKKFSSALALYKHARVITIPQIKKKKITGLLLVYC